MSNDSFQAGDVVWAPDPYNEGARPRPWLVLTAENLPYQGEEYICAGLTLSDLPPNHEIADADWVTGNDPSKTSYCSPWVLATVKHDEITAPQGSVTDEFTESVLRHAIKYLAGDIEISVSVSTNSGKN